MLLTIYILYFPFNKLKFRIQPLKYFKIHVDFQLI